MVGTSDVLSEERNVAVHAPTRIPNLSRLSRSHGPGHGALTSAEPFFCVQAIRTYIRKSAEPALPLRALDGPQSHGQQRLSPSLIVHCAGNVLELESRAGSFCLFPVQTCPGPAGFVGVQSRRAPCKGAVAAQLSV